MRLFRFAVGGPEEVTATLDDPGDIRTSTDELPLSITMENHTDENLLATKVEISMREARHGGRRGSGGSSVTREVNTMIPANGTAGLVVTLPLTLSAISEELPEEAPAWMRTILDRASTVAEATADSGEFDVRIAVHIHGLDKPACDSRRIYRHGWGSFGFRL